MNFKKLEKSSLLDNEKTNHFYGDLEEICSLSVKKLKEKKIPELHSSRENTLVL